MIDKTVYIQQAAETKPTTPVFSLVFYSTPSGTAVTRHAFKNEQMLTGEILDSDTVLELLTEFKKEELNNQADRNSMNGEEVSLIPSNLLFEDSSTLVWFQPSRIARMWFRLSGSEPFSLSVEWTSTLFLLEKQTKKLRVMSVDSNERPTLDTMTYWSPYANIYETLNLCQGSAPLPQIIDRSTITEIENTFYDSAFDSFLNKKLFKKATKTTDGITFWKEKQANGKSVDVANELFPFVPLREILKNRKNIPSLLKAHKG